MIARIPVLIAALGLLAAAPACSGLWGDCGDPEPLPLEAGTYAFSEAYLSPNLPLADVADGSLTIDLVASTVTLTYTREGVPVTETFVMGEVQDGYY